MNAADAREYLFSLTAGLKIAEKRLAEARSDAALWDRRAALAHARDAGADLEAAARDKAAEARSLIETLEREAAETRRMIEEARREMPGRAARERRVDPDLLQQELLMAQGIDPGDEATAARERKLAQLEAEQAAEDALAALKARVGVPGSTGP